MTRAPEIVCQPDCRVRSKPKFPDYLIALIVDVLDTADRAKATFLVAFVCFFFVAPKQILESGETECCLNLSILHCNFYAMRWMVLAFSCGTAMSKQSQTITKWGLSGNYLPVIRERAEIPSEKNYVRNYIILPRVTSKSMNCNTD